MQDPAAGGLYKHIQKSEAHGLAQSVRHLPAWTLQSAAAGVSYNAGELVQKLCASTEFKKTRSEYNSWMCKFALLCYPFIKTALLQPLTFSKLGLTLLVHSSSCSLMFVSGRLGCHKVSKRINQSSEEQFNLGRMLLKTLTTAWP